MNLPLPPLQAKKCIEYEQTVLIRNNWISEECEWWGFFFQFSNLCVLTQETTFGLLDTRGVGVLQSVERLLADIYIPALSKSSNWGDLSDKHGASVRQGFMNQLDNFVGKLMKKWLRLINDMCECHPLKCAIN